MNIIKGGVGKAKSVLEKYEGDNPHTAGQVRSTIGGVLLADGLVGLEDPFDGKKSRPGILGAAGALVVAVIVLVVGVFVIGTAPETNATTNGTISYVSEPSKPDSEGKGGGSCSTQATFEVAGTTYTAASSVSTSGMCRKAIGSGIEVHYNTDNPAENRVGASPSKVGWAVVGVGALSLLGALLTFTIRAASIVFGFVLLRSGRKMMKENPKTEDDSGVISEARTAIVNVLKGRPMDSRISNETMGRGGGAVAGGLAGGVLGGLIGNRTLGALAGAGLGGFAGDRLADEADQARAREHAPTEPLPAAPNAPVAPPVTPAVAPGWYATADGAHLRWHDGTKWTDHVTQVPAQGQ